MSRSIHHYLNRLPSKAAEAIIWIIGNESVTIVDPRKIATLNSVKVISHIFRLNITEIATAISQSRYPKAAPLDAEPIFHKDGSLMGFMAWDESREH